MSSISLDEDQLATLTPEERAAIEDGEGVSDADLASLKNIAGTNGDDEDGDDSDEVLDADGKPVVVATAVTPALAAAPAASAALVSAVATIDNTEGNRAPDTGYVATLPADFDQRVDQLKTLESELRAKFKAGDLDVDEYETQRDTIAATRSELDGLRVKAELTQEMAQHNARQTWKNEVETFIAQTARAGGIDYRTDASKADDLNDFVKALANKNENEGKSGAWFLAEAHRRVNAMYGVSVSAPVAPPRGRKPPLDAVPMNLSQVPGGDGPGDVASEFANLDALDGEELEGAIAKMTPAQREKFASGR